VKKLSQKQKRSSRFQGISFTFAIIFVFAFFTSPRLIPQGSTVNGFVVHMKNFMNRHTLDIIMCRVMQMVPFSFYSIGIAKSIKNKNICLPDSSDLPQKGPAGLIIER